MTLEPSAWSSLERELLGDPPYGPGKDTKNILPAPVPLTCPLCGHPADHLETHHKDGNNDNDDPSNRIDICEECHRKVTNFNPPKSQKDRKNESPAVAVGVDGDGNLTPTEKLIEAARYGEGPATMKARRHIFPVFWQILSSYMKRHERVEYDYAAEILASGTGGSIQSMKYEYMKSFVRPGDCQGPEEEDTRPFEVEQNPGSKYDQIVWRSSYLKEHPDILYEIALNVVSGQRTWGGIKSRLEDLNEWAVQRTGLEKMAKAELDEVNRVKAALLPLRDMETDQS